ncbi:uncharacterized protein LOC109087133 [Cyprinus carpio]|uniref:Uncharacterized protein LOC109087133 n=1 Tax=Cyprinus carpio TaxID=7962 RepID=A0A9Q9Y3R2_CYPCA|nr:uncharacterized protein LOC109087133 [Cyprinus carpio]XP_042612636.1 uncharacterized protein LOC109087133 [Cyprinus carpio]
MRLKLQYALDLKELQSQNWRNVSRSPVSSCILQTHLPLAQHNVNGLMEMRVSDPLVELKRFLRELRGGAEEQGPHTTLSFRRRPEEDHKSRHPIGTKGAESTTRTIGRINSYSEPGSFRTSEPNKQDHPSPLSADNNAVCFRAGQTCCSCSVCATGRRSPVHPTDRNYWLEMERLAYANQISANNQDELTGQASQKIKLDRP